MRYVLALLAVMLLGIGCVRDNKTGKEKQAIKPQAAKVGVTAPTGCKRVMRYTIAPKFGKWVDILECIDSSNRRAIFYKGFGDATWYHRYVK